MNNFEQPSQSAPEKQKKWQEEAEKMGQEIQERRAQREAASKESETKREIKVYPRYGSRTIERIQQVEKELAEERKAAGTSREQASETKEGKRFRAEMLTSPEDPRVEKVHEMLSGHFGEEEVDSIEVMKQAMTGTMETGEKCPKYLVHVAENPEGKIEGLHTGAVVETVNVDGKVSEESAVQLGCYTLISPEARGKGVWKVLFDAQEEAAKKDAESRGLAIKGFMAEAHGEMEPVLNSKEVKRVYIKMADGSFRELPYEQPPLDWDTETGKPAEGAGTVPEHLMLRLSSGANELSGEELMEMIRGMYYYNNYREEEYFDNREAHQMHTEFVESIEQKLIEAIGEGKVYLLSQKEREDMQGQGVKFEEHIKKETSEKEKNETETAGQAPEQIREGRWDNPWDERNRLLERLDVDRFHAKERFGGRLPKELNEEFKKRERLIQYDFKHEVEQWRRRGEEIGMREEREAIQKAREAAGLRKDQQADQNREEIHEEIARHLVERPGEAMDIFKKGVGLKLERAAIGFTSFWKKAGAEALKAASLPAEKVAGGYLEKVSQTVWAAQEYLLARPGAKRLEAVLQAQAHIKTLRESGAMTEDEAKYALTEVMKRMRVTGDLSAEIEDHRQWEKWKKDTLDIFKTFGHARDKLSRWAEKQQAMTARKKEEAKERKVRKTAEKF